MFSIGSWDRHDQRIIANFPILAAPGWHIWHGVGPADADASLISSLPSIGTTAHPVIVITKGYDAGTVCPGQFTGTIHGTFGIQRAEATVSIPALHDTHTYFTGRSGCRVNTSLFQVADKSWKTVQPVGIDTGKTVLCKNRRCISGILRKKSFLFQDSCKLFDHIFIFDSHNTCSSQWNMKTLSDKIYYILNFQEVNLF